ncbi:uridine diphosphate-N-acetylglucosamine-binding protein YvcK [Jatrophihabitans endophyticus]|uniref:gluconeogenesis factor YvcK family protein n=1 Tax=Jatrophihabitans endophyticus TaxID=1206085 RepID=UPI001A06AB1D|nr:uridine diphosphate-N-acetylglucosamine-binding protein YvcK [Jatrophihabitans endophyticus]MBE7186954.1 uridine diphosphate-N-acetylglucosamine-binding protein YvcK [Jatrophihabitans endophyticus]
MTRPRPKIVALGGGHGLHAALSAARLLGGDLTAIVTVADDGGSSGRIRRELKVLPPGDLRMALAALASGDAEHAAWTDLLQHRIGGTGVLAGHPVGNLMLTALLERERDAVAALDRLAGLVGAVGRVLPMSPVPLDLVGEADRFDPDDPARTRAIRGQVSIATTPGRVVSVSLLPPGAPACAEAVDAVREADLLLLGPGSWFTSVLPHLLLRELGKSIASTSAKVVVVLNLVQQAGETDDYEPHELLELLQTHAEPFGGLRIDAVLADTYSLLDPQQLRRYVDGLGARLIVRKLAADDSVERHDPVRLSEAIRSVMAPEHPADRDTEGSTEPWR